MMNLNDYLREYYKKQKTILLVYRPSLKHSWGDRTLYLGDNYDQEKQYNHRIILEKELVIEFDDENPQINEQQAILVGKSLKRDGIKYSMWDSGNKSLHIHFFINTREVGNIRLLKKVVMRYYTEGMPVKPDMRLAAENHLIRAEFGIHEKSGRRKRPIFKSRDCFVENNLSQKIWQLYSTLRTTTIKRRTATDLNDKCSCLKYIASAEDFRENQDGCERALFILIHSGLKDKYTRQQLEDYLWEWYRYVGGYKMSEQDIRQKVKYHYHRNYGTYSMIKELLEDLGKEKILEGCLIHGNIQKKK